MDFPVYKIAINMDDESNGLTAVSLVDFPAVEHNFLLFDKQELLFKADDEKQIISGIALLADTPIYRRNDRGEFYVVFESDTIRQLVEKYSKDGMFNSVNLMHNDNAFVNDVYMIESIIIDKERGICPVEFKDVPNGSWYISYYVANKELWNEIKNGEWFKGFSVEVTADLKMNSDFNTNKFDIEILSNNKNNYPLIYKNNKLMYEETTREDNELIYKYYDATTKEFIKETIMEMQ